jgi:hypothetical protein
MHPPEGTLGPSVTPAGVLDAPRPCRIRSLSESNLQKGYPLLNTSQHIRPRLGWTP